MLRTPEDPQSGTTVITANVGDSAALLVPASGHAEILTAVRLLCLVDLSMGIAFSPLLWLSVVPVAIGLHHLPRSNHRQLQPRFLLAVCCLFCLQDHGPDCQEEYLRVRALSQQEFPQKLQFVYDK